MVFERRIRLLVIPSLFPRYDGDVQGVFIVDYLRAVKAYCDITVFFLQLSGDVRGHIAEESDDVRIYRHTISRRSRLCKLFKPLLYVGWFIQGYRFGKKLGEQCDIIHVHGGTFCGALTRWIAWRCKVPFVITEHTGPFSKISKRPIHRWLCKWAMEGSRAVLTVSEDLKQQILDASIHPSTCYVTYNPVDTETFILRRDSESCNILFVGRMEPYKGALRTLLAFQLIQKQYPEWTLTLVGDGPDMVSIRRVLSADEALARQVVLPGALDKPAIAEQMGKTAFFVFPSEHETFGIVIAEAMSAGLPVIVGDQTAPREFVDSTCGILVSPTGVDQIAQAMTYMIQHHCDYDAEKIRQRVVERFGFNAFGKRLKKIYEEVL